MRGYTYILASKKGGTLYTGVTSDLPRRAWEHREGLTYEEFAWMIDAIAREKAIKSWPRRWKVELIEENNPDWRDLYPHLLMF